MPDSRAVFHVALADLRQRLRTPAYLVLALLVAVVGVRLTTGDLVLVVGSDATGRPTAGWVAVVVASMGTMLVLVFGYSLVGGTLARDRESGVGELVATTPVGNGSYLLGKWLASAAVLGLVTAVLVLATLVGFLRHGTGPLDPWALVAPFLFVTLPAAALVAAVAVCFETVGVLRGTLGTAVYFAGALVLLTAVALASDPPFDPFGIAVVRESAVAALAAQHPTFQGPVRGFAFTDRGPELTYFTWTGVRWTAGRLLDRALVLVAAGGFLVAAAALFDRFDPTAGAASPDATPEPTGTGTADPPAPGREATRDPPELVAPDPPSATEVTLSPLAGRSGRVPVGRLLVAQVRLALRGRRRWWYAALVGLVLAGLMLPAESARRLALPFAFLAPLSVWSALGVRERRHGTEEVVFTTNAPLALLAIEWASGVLVALLAASGAAVGLLLAGQPDVLFGLLAGACFVPALAVALGTWTGTARAFEVVFLTLWYAGPMNRVAPLDFAGAVPGSAAAGAPAGFAVAAAVLLGVALAGRWRRLRR